MRRNLGLTQQGIADDLQVSVAYISLIESNQRPITADLLLRVARTYKIDMAEFAGDGGEAATARLQAALRDPLFADIDLPALQVADVAVNYPGIADALLRLHAAHREESRALADRRAGLDPEQGGDPVGEIRRFLAAARNNFPALDAAAERIAAAIGDANDLAAYIATRHKLRVRELPSAAMGGMIRRHDPHHKAIFIDDSLDRASRRFQLATQVAYLECDRELAAAMADTEFTDDNTRRLARRALASYAAAAILMPYARFLKAAKDRCYDVEALARIFGTSFEQVAHRLTTLQRSGHEGLPFFFIRVDAAGNVSKRLDGARFPFATHGGGCPLWVVHQVFRTPGQVLTQWVELPDGERFFTIARLVATGGGAFGVPRIERAVALGCAAEHAGQLAHAGGRNKPAPSEITPIGITCSLCQREACAARAVPPIGRQLLPDDYHRRRAPFGFGDA